MNVRYTNMPLLDSPLKPVTSFSNTVEKTTQMAIIHAGKFLDGEVCGHLAKDTIRTFDGRTRGWGGWIGAMVRLLHLTEDLDKTENEVYAKLLENKGVDREDPGK